MIYEKEFFATFENVDEQVTKVCKELKKEPVRPKKEDIFNIDYVLREVLNNAVEHGCKCDENKKVFLRVSFQSEELLILVSDEGSGFDLLEELNKENEMEGLPLRNRGLSSILAMGMHLSTAPNGIEVSYSLKNKCETAQGREKRMEIIIENQVLICKLNDNLVSKNIKKMVETIRPFLERTDEFHTVKIYLDESSGIDSMGVTFLIGVYKTLLAKERELVLCDVPEPMINLFKIMKLDEVFQFQIR